MSTHNSTKVSSIIKDLLTLFKDGFIIDTVFSNHMTPVHALMNPFKYSTYTLVNLHTDSGNIIREFYGDNKFITVDKDGNINMYDNRDTNNDEVVKLMGTDEFIDAWTDFIMFIRECFSSYVPPELVESVKIRFDYEQQLIIDSMDTSLPDHIIPKEITNDVLQQAIYIAVAYGGDGLLPYDSNGNCINGNGCGPFHAMLPDTLGRTTITRFVTRYAAIVQCYSGGLKIDSRFGKRITKIDTVRE